MLSHPVFVPSQELSLLLLPGWRRAEGTLHLLEKGKAGLDGEVGEWKGGEVMAHLGLNTKEERSKVRKGTGGGLDATGAEGRLQPGGAGSPWTDAD